jgi:leader peptidase (prepilin peptidase) / N-methyltransferase
VRAEEIGSMLILAAAAAAAVGLLGGPTLTARGLSKLDCDGRFTPQLNVGSRVAAGVAGTAAVVATERAGWWLLPALLVWAYVLAAAASCDASTQRVPTPLVRQGGAATAALLVGGSAITGDWRGLAAAALATLAAGLILGFCWRVTGAGLGDVRLAVLGGLGLGHVTHLGLVIGVATFALSTLTTAAVTLAHGATRHSTIPYGPALVAGFLLAAAF